MQYTTFLVEHYLPRPRVVELETVASRIQAAESIRVLQITVVPEDESVLCLIAGSSEDAVRAAYARAGIDFDRISIAIAHDHTPKGDGNVK